MRSFFLLLLGCMFNALITGCAIPNPPPYRTHTSAGIPEMPVMPFFPRNSKDPKKIHVSLGGEIQKGVAWDDEGSIGTSRSHMIPMAFWFTPSIAVGGNINHTETFSIDNNDKAHLDLGLMAEFIPIRSDTHELGIHFGYNSGDNTHETDSCRDYNAFKRQQDPVCLPTWRARATVTIKDYPLALILGQKVIERLYLKLTPGIRYTRINALNHLDETDDIVHKKAYFSPFVSGRLSYETDTGTLFIGAGYFKNHGFGISEGTTRKSWVYQVGVAVGG